MNRLENSSNNRLTVVNKFIPKYIAPKKSLWVTNNIQLINKKQLTRNVHQYKLIHNETGMLSLKKQAFEQKIARETKSNPNSSM